jgi:hypothetical protein
LGPKSKQVWKDVTQKERFGSKLRRGNCLKRKKDGDVSLLENPHIVKKKLSLSLCIMYIRRYIWGIYGSLPAWLKSRTLGQILLKFCMNIILFKVTPFLYLQFLTFGNNSVVDAETCLVATALVPLLSYRATHVKQINQIKYRNNTVTYKGLA